MYVKGHKNLKKKCLYPIVHDFRESRVKKVDEVENYVT